MLKFQFHTGSIIKFKKSVFSEVPIFFEGGLSEKFSSKI